MVFNEEYYKKVYDVSDLNKFDQHWWSNYFYSRLVLRYCKKPGANVLELGCGFGGIIKRLENNFKIYGIEISDYALSLAKKQCPNAKLFLGDIDCGLRSKIGGVSFDCILARYVFEHLKNPEGVIVDCAKMLNDRGRLIFAVPNTASLARKLKGQMWHGFRDLTHISLKDPDAWLAILHNAGFKVLRTFGDGFWDIPYFKAPKLFQYPMLLPTVLEILTEITFIPKSWGENLIVIAEK